MKRRVYISGPISGRDYQIAFEEFDQMETILYSAGFCPKNPCKNGLPKNSTWRDHMKVDIAMMMECEAIYFLPGWWRSRGALLERVLAWILGIKTVNVRNK